MIAFLGGKRAKNNFEKTRKVYRVCGCLLFLLAVTLSAIVILMNKTNMHFEYAGMMIYAAAAYTFYKIIAAAVQFSKAKKRGGLVVQALRNFNLADAAVFRVRVAGRDDSGVRECAKRVCKQYNGRSSGFADLGHRALYDRKIVHIEAAARWGRRKPMTCLFCLSV